MEVAELWRYPVKSMAGERIGRVRVGQRGLAGDRRVAAFETGPGSRDRPVSARRLAPLLRFRAVWRGRTVEVTGPDLGPVPWDDSAVGPSLERVCGRGLELRPVPEGAFDDSPVLLLHLATTRALARELGAPVDHRRFRANIYLAGSGLDAHREPELLGRRVRCGAAVLEVTASCARCAITTRAPDTFEVWPELLRHLVREHGELAGVYCRVEVPGTVSEGDPIELC